jgi:hypothetical protein
MQISLLLNNGEEIRLKPVRFMDKPEDENFYRLVPVDGSKEYMKLELKDNHFAIIETAPEIAEPEDRLRIKLDELVLAVIESQQSGTEDDESESDWTEDPYDPDKIRVDTKTFSLKQVFEMINDGDIDLSPDFQRHFVWDNFRKSRLIESILLRIPLPMFYFAQDPDGRIAVVDGLQRLTTIRDFMANKFMLRDLEYLSSCEGKYYNAEGAALEPKYYRWFNMTQIVVNIIDPQSPIEVKYDIFKRINTGGKPLNAQEIRNCLATKIVRKTLRDMKDLESFKSATRGSVKDVRMEAQELALRFIAFHRLHEEDPSLENYTGNVEWTLDVLVDDLNQLSEEELSKYITLYDRAMQNAEHLFGRYAFRKCQVDHINAWARTQLINKALLVSWSVFLNQYDPQEIRSKYEPQSLAMPLAEMITEDHQLFMYLTYSTNSKANVQAAFRAAEMIIESHLKG